MLLGLVVGIVCMAVFCVSVIGNDIHHKVTLTMVLSMRSKAGVGTNGGVKKDSIIVVVVLQVGLMIVQGKEQIVNGCDKCWFHLWWWCFVTYCANPIREQNLCCKILYSDCYH